MRILFFVESLVSGGKERRLIELMRALKLRKDIHFELVLMSKEVHYKEVFNLGVEIHFIIRKTKKDVGAFYRFYKLCRKNKPDIIHCWDSMTAIYSVPACLLLGIKLVNGMVINTPVKQNILNKYWLRAKITFPFSDVVVGNSLAGLKAYRAPVKKSTVIYNGFNFDRVGQLADKESLKSQLNIGSQTVVGMVAAFSESKDYKTYYTAAKSLLDKRSDIIFLAIGPDTDSPDSKMLIDNHYSSYFRLLGSISGVESYINIMDIGVLATFTEGVSNSILEYMAFEKPVIATEGGGTNEILVDGVTGYLINPSDPEDLARRMQELLDDVGLRSQMGSAGNKRINDNFSIDRMFRNYIDLYGLILSKRRFQIDR